jgi:hypothetical protein
MPCLTSLMVQYTVSSIMHCSSIKRPHAGSLDNWLLNWRKGTWTLARDFCNDMKQKEVDSWSTQWLDMNAGQILPASNSDGKQRMVPFQLNITKTFCTWAIVGKVMLTSFWHHQGPFVSTACPSRLLSSVSHNVTSLGIIWAQPSNQESVDCSVLVSCCSTIMLGHILPMWPDTIKDSRVSPSSSEPAWTLSLWVPSLGHKFLIWQRSTRHHVWVTRHAAEKNFSTRNSAIVKHLRTCTKHTWNTVEPG